MILRRFTKHIAEQNWFAVGLDVLVVITGIFLGMQVTEWNENRNNSLRTMALLEAFRAEMGDFTSVYVKVERNVSAGLMAFDTARARGERVPPYVWRFKGSNTPPLTTWDVAQQSGIAELIHPSLLFELGFYYSEQEGIGAKFARYSEFVDSEVMPRLADPAAFYDASGNLKGEFAQNMERLREWLAYSKVLAVSANCLQKRFETPTEPGEYCRPDFDQFKNQEDAP